MKFRTLLSFVLVAIALISCKDDDATETRSAAEAEHHYTVAMTGVV